MTPCSNCGRSLEGSTVFCVFCGTRLDQKLSQVSLTDRDVSYVEVYPNGEIIVTARTITEAKLAIKELKLRKKELSLLKRQVTEQERAIRAEYTHNVRQRGSKFRGGGWIGRVVRDVQTASRDSAKRSLANQLAPFEQQKREIEALVVAIEEVILKVEAMLLNGS